MAALRGGGARAPVPRTRALAARRRKAGRFPAAAERGLGDAPVECLIGRVVELHHRGCVRVSTAREAWLRNPTISRRAPARGVHHASTAAREPRATRTSGRTSCGRARRAARAPRARAPPEGRAPARREGATRATDPRRPPPSSPQRRPRDARDLLRLRGRRECGRRALREVQHRPRGTRLQERLHRAAREVNVERVLKRRHRLPALRSLRHKSRVTVGYKPRRRDAAVIILYTPNTPLPEFSRDSPFHVVPPRFQGAAAVSPPAGVG